MVKVEKASLNCYGKIYIIEELSDIMGPNNVLFFIFQNIVMFGRGFTGK